MKVLYMLLCSLLTLASTASAQANAFRGTLLSAKNGLARVQEDDRASILELRYDAQSVFRIVSDVGVEDIPEGAYVQVFGTQQQESGIITSHQIRLNEWTNPEELGRKTAQFVSGNFHRVGNGYELDHNGDRFEVRFTPAFSVILIRESSPERLPQNVRVMTNTMEENDGRYRIIGLFAYPGRSPGLQGFEDEGGGELVWNQQLESNLEEARDSGKRVLIYFYTPEAVRCKELEEGLFKSPAFRDAAQGLILVRKDAAAVPEAARRYGVFRAPTVVLLGPEGTMDARFDGAGLETALLEQMRGGGR